MKVCRNCGKEKKEESFGVNKALKSGRNSICKICLAQYQREHKIKKIKLNEKNSDIKLQGLHKNDWCGSYSLLKELGYDVEIDIHLQFVTKYGLEYKDRPKKNTLNYTYQDCLDCSNKTNLLTD